MGDDLTEGGVIDVGGPANAGDAAFKFQSGVDDIWTVGIDSTDTASTRPLKVSRGNTFGATTRLELSDTGNLRLNAYGAGTLQTDVNGNVTVGTAGAGDVVMALDNNVDNVIMRADGTTGKSIQGGATYTLGQEPTIADDGFVTLRNGLGVQGNVGVTQPLGTDSICDVTTGNNLGDSSQINFNKTTELGGTVTQNHLLGQLNFNGLDQGSNYTAGARIQANTFENWTGGTYGSNLLLSNIADGDTSASVRFQLHHSGDCRFSNTDVRLTSPGRVLQLSSNATDPLTPNSGDLYYNSTTNVVRFYNGTAWQDAVADASLLWRLPGLNNFAYGVEALNSITTASNNFAIGNEAMEFVQTGQNNVALGNRSMQNRVGGDNNVGVGNGAGKGLGGTSGNNNVSIGTASHNSLNATSGDNIAIGSASGVNITNGSRNVTIGGESGTTVSLGVDNVFIGHQSNGTAGGDNNQIGIGSGAICDLGNQCTIGNASLSVVRPGATNVCDLGQTGRRYKNLYLSANLIQPLSTIATTTDPGVEGEIRYDANNIFICTAPNNWKKADLKAI
jgi:hypothetical protein